MNNNNAINAKINTKTRIFYTAVQLFSERGYTNVSVRDIAAEVNIKVSSLYNHYPSKADILSSLYKYYTAKFNEKKPDIDLLLKQAGSEPVHEVFKKLDFHFDPEDAETTDRIMAIACTEFRRDEISARFVHDNIFNLSKIYIIPLLERLIELKKIEPMDIKSFSVLTAMVSFGAAACNYSRFHVTINEWGSAFDLLFSLVKPV
jgi:AcrR family transcriptional regulator